MRKRGRRTRRRGEEGKKKEQDENPHSLMISTITVSAKKRMRKTERGPNVLPQDGAPTLIFDCSFDDKMTYKEKLSLTSQLQYVYGKNRNAKCPFNILITSVSGVCREQLQKNNCEKWKGVTVEDGHYTQLPQLIQNKDNIVYLSAEAQEDLVDVEDGKYYVIGAIVDRNRYKGLSQSAAEQHGIRSARLPLHLCELAANACKVLTCTHVYELLQTFASNGKDWPKALLSTVPKRKLRHAQEDDEDEEKGKEEGEGKGDEEGEGEGEGEGETQEIPNARTSSLIPSLCE